MGHQVFDPQTGFIIPSPFKRCYGPVGPCAFENLMALQGDPAIPSPI